MDQHHVQQQQYVDPYRDNGAVTTA
ncbi:hypothetical protein EE612_002888 [Oryza sativa]|nr:hypothetical protein EE612_002888 [Oryza sativa]